MKIDLYFTATEVDPASLFEATVVVIDVLRATTTMVEALANGARGIYPTSSTEDAVKLAQSFGREDALLCGERKGQKIEGFDLGNSPAEFVPEVVAGKRLVMSTTNGTRCFEVGQHGARLLACAFTNLSATARSVAADEEVVVICAGREDEFSLDDALCAGHLIGMILDVAGQAPGLNDAARAARILAVSRKPTRKFLAETKGGKVLIEIGLGDDLELCTEVDRHDVVAEMLDQAIVVAGA